MARGVSEKAGKFDIYICCGRLRYMTTETENRTVGEKDTVVKRFKQMTDAIKEWSKKDGLHPYWVNRKEQAGVRDVILGAVIFGYGIDMLAKNVCIENGLTTVVGLGLAVIGLARFLSGYEKAKLDPLDLRAQEAIRVDEQRLNEQRVKDLLAQMEKIDKIQAQIYPSSYRLVVDNPYCSIGVCVN